MIKTADVVLHIPTGESWVVACVEGDRLSWVGWPEGWANLSDCVLIDEASPEERHKLLVQMSRMSTDDHRRRFARQALELEPAVKP